jgi:hypothetical protein
METRKGFNVGGKHRASHELKLLKNICGGRAGGRIWTEHLRKGLAKLGFEQCASDPCVFFPGNLIFLHFVDDCICLSPNPDDKSLADLRAANFNVTDEGQLSDHLGVKIEKSPDGKFKLTQPPIRALWQSQRQRYHPRSSDATWTASRLTRTGNVAESSAR